MSYCEVVKTAAESGCFGDRILEKIELDEEKQSAFQIASSLFFVKVVTGNIQRALVVKIQPSHTRVSEEVYRNSLFVNEVCFYSKLLPFLSKLDKNVVNLFPKYYYGCATFGQDVTKDAVIVEDLSPMGFIISNLGKELDVDHITLILKTLAMFHALSYKAKQEFPVEFRRLLSDLKNDTETVYDYVETAMYGATMRYQGSQNNTSKLKDKCNSIKNFQLSLIPKEPYSVLCHGDICSHNTLFSYNKNGKPEKLKFIDLQRCRYASPGIDLSFFLLYNTTTSTKIHWDYFLHIYYESLTTYANVAVPSFSEFMEDFITHIIYGISTCSYFFPLISLTPKELNEFLLLELTEKTKVIGKLGGEKAHMLMNEMFQLVLGKEYI